MTNEEVQHGILEVDEAHRADQVAFFVRIFEDIEDNVQDKEAKNFIDLSYAGGKQSVDGEAQKLLSALRDQQVPASLPESRIFKHNLKWKPEAGVDPEFHREYLDKFLEQFYSTVIGMIDQAAQEEIQARRGLSTHPIYEEILEHLTFCKSHAENFLGAKRSFNKSGATWTPIMRTKNLW